MPKLLTILIKNYIILKKSDFYGIIERQMCVENLVNKIIQEMKVNDVLTCDEEIVRTGLYIMITKLVFTIIMLIIGILTDSFIESIIFMLSFTLIRQYGGGYHAETKSKCFVLSVLSFLVGLVIIKLSARIPIISMILWVISGISAVYIFCKSPVDTKNKRLDEDEIRVYGHRAKILTVIVVLTAVIFYILNFHCITISILTGILSEAYLMVKGSIYNKMESNNEQK